MRQRRRPREPVSGRTRTVPSALILSAALSAGAGAAAAATRQEVEADWRRQDESRMAEIRQPGTVRFAATTLRWAGVHSDDRLRVPRSAAANLDGRLDDACWRRAARLDAAGKGEPTFRLCHDDRRLYVGVAIPAGTERRYFGDATARDAAGAVDGVKNGRYAFHTGRQAYPWWQVDLGERRRIGRIVVYNRLDYAPGLHNADHLMILTSDDGRAWTRVYHNGGRFFGGVGRGKPLEVRFGRDSRRKHPPELRARFVRLQVDAKQPVYFHLDEVEVYAADEPGRNIALGRPAAQSSLSRWSRRGRGAGALFRLGRTRVGLRADGACVTVNGEDIAGPGAGARSPRARSSPARREAIAQGAVAGRDGQTCVEVALPLAAAGRLPAEFRPPDGRRVRLASGRWQLRWDKNAKLGFGSNRLAVELQASGTLDPPVEVTIESVVFTRTHPRRQVVFREALSAAKAARVDFQVACEGAAALLVSARQGEQTFRDGRTYFIEPVAETLARAAALLREFAASPPPALADLRRRASALAERERIDGPNPPARAKLYLAARRLAREVAFANPLLAFDKLLFVKRFTQETYPDVCLNHMPWCSRPGGDICILSAAKGGGRAIVPDGEAEVRNLLNGALGPGHVHGMDLSWDARRVVFGYAKARGAHPPEGWRDRRSSFGLRRTEEPTHLFEIALDGGAAPRPRQLTAGQWSDLDPTCLPNGDVAFVSERCATSLQCNEYDKDETSCNLYVLHAGDGRIRRLSASKDGDYLPHVLDDGTIGYTRWEYQERGWAHIQSIWTVRPDGRFADALFKQHLNNPWALEDVRSAPGSAKLVAVATGHHTLAAGPVVLLSPCRGLNHPDGIEIVTPGAVPPEGGMAGRVVAAGGLRSRGGFYMTPWALSDRHFLVSYTFGRQSDPVGYALYLIDVYGTKELIYRDAGISCFEPIPLRRRPRPPVLGDAVDSPERPATCVVSDVARGVDGVQPRAIRYLRVAQRLAWPYSNRCGGQRYERDVKRVMVNWTPVRVLGTVPVEPDGSAHFRVPPDRGVYFQILDAEQRELRRMRSFISLQPGEVRGCSGCHETRAEAPPRTRTPLALRREASVPVPPPWGARPISFLRDVQCVLDRHCVRCHAGLKPAARLDLSGGLTARHNRAYDTILARRLVARSNVGDDAKVTPPLAFGSRKSRLLKVLAGAAHRQRVELSREDRLRLIIWIDANAPYHDGFLNKRAEVAPYDLPADAALAKGIAAVHARRCAPCHKPGDVSRLDWIDLRAPKRSGFLTAPLAKGAGGRERCKQAVYAGPQDEDYQAVLRLVNEAVRRAWQRPRRDVRALVDEATWRDGAH